MNAELRDGALTWGAVVLGGVFVGFIALALAGLVLHSPPALVLAQFAQPVVYQALGVSLLTTAVSAVIIVLVGTPLAAVLSRPFRGRTLLETFVMLPIVLPPVVAGYALLLAFGRAGLLGGALGSVGIHLPFTTIAVIMAQTLVAAPLYVIAAKNAFERADPELLDAAATLRASPAYTFVRVVLPTTLPALGAGLALAWARALGEFGATITFAGNLPGVTQTMPVAVFMAGQDDPNAAIALAVALVALSFAVLIGARRFANRTA